MLPKLRRYNTQHRLWQRGDRLLVAVSGGPDSMVLLHLLQQEPLALRVAHVNYGLRGDASVAEEQLVRDYCIRHGLPLDVLNAPLKEAGTTGSIQMRAREIRYTWFENLRTQHQMQAVATAHQQDDQAETVLLHLLRGSGLTGLHGMRPRQDHLIRPLLSCSRKEIEDYAAHHQVPCLLDASNREAKYERNRVRLELLPLMETFNPSVKEALAGMADKVLEAEGIYAIGLRRLRKKLLHLQGTGQAVFTAALRDQPYAKTFLHEWLTPFGFREEQLDSLLPFLQQPQPGKWVESAGHRVLVDRKQLILCPKEAPVVAAVAVATDTKKIVLGTSTLHFTTLPATGFKLPADPAVHCLNADRLQFPLLIRTWRAGDYFYPQGMKMKKKKISDFYAGLHLNKEQKEHTWLLFSENHLAAVLGHRIDERYRIGPGTRNVLRIEHTVR